MLSLYLSVEEEPGKGHGQSALQNRDEYPQRDHGVRPVRGDAGLMGVPARDRELVRIMDAALADVERRAGFGSFANGVARSAASLGAAQWLLALESHPRHSPGRSRTTSPAHSIGCFPQRRAHPLGDRTRIPEIEPSTSYQASG
jgi:hypothetical protein